jgi:hypothetical protein
MIFKKKTYVIIVFFIIPILLIGCGNNPRPSYETGYHTIFDFTGNQKINPPIKYVFLSMNSLTQNDPVKYEINLDVPDNQIEFEYFIINSVLKEFFVVGNGGKIVRMFPVRRVGIDIYNPSPPFSNPDWTCENNDFINQPIYIPDVYLQGIEISPKFKIAWVKKNYEDDCVEKCKEKLVNDDEHLTVSKENCNDYCSRDLSEYYNYFPNNFNPNAYNTAKQSWKHPVTYIEAVDLVTGSQSCTRFTAGTSEYDNGCCHLGSTIHPGTSGGSIGCISLSSDNLLFLFRYVYNSVFGNRKTAKYITDPVIEVIDSSNKVFHYKIKNREQDVMGHLVRPGIIQRGYTSDFNIKIQEIVNDHEKHKHIIDEIVCQNLNNDYSYLQGYDYSDDTMDLFIECGVPRQEITPTDPSQGNERYFISENIIITGVSKEECKEKGNCWSNALGECRKSCSYKQGDSYYCCFGHWVEEYNAYNKDGHLNHEEDYCSGCIRQESKKLIKIARA